MRIKNILLITVAALSLGACSQVNGGERGVESYYGRVDPTSLTGGLYWYNPWSTDFIKMDVHQKKWGDSTESYTKDVQKANIDFVLNYHLNPDRAADMYARVGKDWADNIIPQATQQAIKNEIGKWEAVAAVEHRGDVASHIEFALRAALAKQDIILDGFDLTNIKFDGAFEQAVEAKQVAVQRAIQAQNHTVEVTENGKQTVIAAQAEADAMKVRATALESNPKLVQYEAVERWDGHLPHYMSGNQLPFITKDGE